ncbi:MAG: helix-turn-helix domain-containing protein [Clostridiales bacterium]|nr:helix-turn-helix domain-containing protein [Clostridiales bacterium]
MYPLEDYIPKRWKQAEMSQDTLSKKIGVPQSQVGRWEKEKEKVPPKHYWKIIGILEGYSGEQI